MRGMRFRCDIDMQNDAFENPEELISILREQVIKKIEENNTGNRVRDSNGNTVGQWAFYEPEDPFLGGISDY